ncbi:carbohydrate kinase family protein [Consotaella aegiceratis]|uniref:carbohydrate kinase family protein n=1 Tax=Consotaella aegiceratis TaxID=3097961 RepID=UPI002F421A22
MNEQSGQVGPSILCLGRLYCDVLFTGLADLPSLGREIFADDVTITPGGGAFITAAYPAAMGRPTGLLARLGLDPLSLALEAPLAESGVDLGLLERSAEAGPQLTVAIVRDGDRAFLSRRASGARPSTFAQALGAPSSRHLHIAEAATLFEMPDAVSAAKERGLTVSLDPSWDDTVIHHADFLALCRGADVFLPNVEEAKAITSLADIDRALDALTAVFPVVALKLGADGAILAEGSSRIRLPAPQVEVVDTTGAGDAFNAGFLDAWLRGGSPEASLTAAIACGSRSVQAVGGSTALRAG